MKPLAAMRTRLQTTVLRAPLVWVRHRGLSERDVFVASFPKSGTTWLRFMLAQVLSGEEVDFDRAGILIPGVEAHAKAPKVLLDGGRLIQTHESFRSAYK